MMNCLPTFPKSEIERIAHEVAAILKKRMNLDFGGDPLNPSTWGNVSEGICPLRVDYDAECEDGFCCTEMGVDESPSRVVLLYILGSRGRTAQIARFIVHEAAHMLCRHYPADFWLDNPYQQFDYCVQAHENIARAVERIILNDFGRGWLPAHGLYWN